VCDVDHKITERQLAAFFVDCGRIVDCRICGDPNSAMRFGFIEFQAEESAVLVSPCAARLNPLFPTIQPS
jgi:RNA recognition motif-containing protein